jgi:membrane associated rhomboid family serine protease
MITIIIIIINVLVSLAAFNNYALMSKLQLNPYQVIHKKEWYRIISHAFVHANWLHLFVNMFVLFSFGQAIEYYFKYAGINNPQLHFLILYFGAIIFSVTTTLKKHKNDIFYNAVGASGAVSAMVFTSILFAPWQEILVFAILPVPGIVIGIIYLYYSSYMGKKGNDNINHDAHLLGALFGLTYPILIKPELFIIFIQKLISFS